MFNRYSVGHAGRIDAIKFTRLGTDWLKLVGLAKQGQEAAVAQERLNQSRGRPEI